MGGGTDLLPQVQRGIASPSVIVDLRGAGLDSLEYEDGVLRVGAGVRVADLAANSIVRERFGVLAEAADQVGTPQLREMGTVGGNLCQRVRCWYFRHPDLTCWLRGGPDCYAQLGDHRKHGLEPGDCISVASSDLACALLALEAQVTTNVREDIPLADLYRRPSADQRSHVALASGEFVTLVTVPYTPDTSAYERLGERGESSFALVGVAAARFGERIRDGSDRCREHASRARAREPSRRPARPPDDGLETHRVGHSRCRCQRASRASSRVVIAEPRAAANDARPDRAGRIVGSAFGRLGLFVTLLWTIPFFWIPFGLLLVYSFGTQDYLTAKMSFGWTLESWRALNDPVVYGAFLRSVRLSTEATIVCAILGYPLAYFVARHAGRFRSWRSSSSSRRSGSASSCALTPGSQSSVRRDRSTTRSGGWASGPSR